MREGLIVRVFAFVGIVSYLERVEGVQQFKKCHPLSGDDANANLEGAVETLKNCFLLNLENFRHIISSNTCSYTGQPLKDCERKVLKTIRDCQSTDTRIFPAEALKIFSAYADEICNQAPQYKLSILLDRETCFPSLDAAISCLQKFRFFDPARNVTQDEMCEDEEGVKECLISYAEEICPKDGVFRRFINATFESDRFLCAIRNSAASNMNSCNSFGLLLFMMVLFLNVLCTND